MNEHHSLGVVRKVWRDLLNGSLKVAATPDMAGYALLLQRTEPPTMSMRRARRQAQFEAALRGTPQKVVGANMDLAVTTVASMMRCALADLGLQSKFSRVPVALPLLAHAALGSSVLALCEVGEAENDDCPLLVTLSTPALVLAATLSAGEQDVVTRYIAGQSHVEIAEARSVSCRTVANQLAVSFKKLGASGRFELLRALVERGAALGIPLKLTLRAVREERMVDSSVRSRGEPTWNAPAAGLRSAAVR